MTSVTDSITVADFSGGSSEILSNNQSLNDCLIPLDAGDECPDNSYKSSKNEIRYERDKLIEISQSSLTKYSKIVIFNQLEKSLSDQNIIRYFLKKESDDDDSSTINNNNNNNSKSFFDNRYKMNSRATRTESPRFESSIKDTVLRADKPYRQAKPYESDNGNWRNSEYVPRSGSKSYSSNKRTGDRPNKYNNRKYSRDEDEDEPEWFSNGPDSMHDFIDLRGFEDEDEKSKALEDNSYSSNSSDLDLPKTSSNMSDINILLNSSLFDSSTSSLDNSEFSLFNSSASFSRMGKWFKKPQEIGSEEGSAGATNSSNVSNNNTAASLFELLQSKNISLNKLSQPPMPNINSMKAVNVADLEASLFNTSNGAGGGGGSANQATPRNDSQSAEILSKLFSSINQSGAKPTPMPFNSTAQTGGGEPKPDPNLNIRNIAELNKMIYANLSKMHQQQQQQQLKRMPMGHPNNVPFNLPPRPYPYPPPMYPPDVPQQFIPGHHPPPPPGMVPPVAPGFFPMVPPNSSYPRMFPMPQNPLPRPPGLAPPSQPPGPPPSTPKQDDSLANKLLKNSKFTPTAVFRKLKADHELKPKSVAASECEPKDGDRLIREQLDLLSGAMRPDSLPINADPKGKENLEQLLQKMNLSLSNSQSLSVRQPNDQQQQQPQINHTAQPFTSLAGLNASSIFNSVQHNERVLPPIPMQNALTLEDLEKQNP